MRCISDRLTVPRAVTISRGLLVATVGFIAAVPVASAGQSANPTEGRWTPLRTPDGQPDISGTWSNETMTVLERPTSMGDKAFFTEEEAEALKQHALDQRARAAEPGGTRTVPLPPGSRMAGYNAAWNDLRNKLSYTRRTSMVTSPADGRVPLSPGAATRRDGMNARKYDAVQHLSPYERCITRGVPGSWLPNTYNTGQHILQIPGYVVIMYEMMRDIRIIPVDDRPHLTARIGQWMGDSRGHWEGETLVVETTNFTDEGWILPNQNAGRIHGVPVTQDLKVVERFTRVHEDILDWQATIEDPAMYTKAWTMELPLARVPDYDLYEYACHEGNYAVPNMLRAARITERDESTP